MGWNDLWDEVTYEMKCTVRWSAHWDEVYLGWSALWDEVYLGWSAIRDEVH